MDNEQLKVFYEINDCFCVSVNDYASCVLNNDVVYWEVDCLLKLLVIDAYEDFLIIKFKCNWLVCGSRSSFTNSINFCWVGHKRGQVKKMGQM